jgi:CsoR family transcriptional regulator, copper-sensing transcriptional repressor
MQEKNEILLRLRKVEGQIRGIQKMIEEDRECTDIIRQVMAVSKALDKVGFLITKRSLNKCIRQSYASGEDPGVVMDEALKMLFDVAKHVA